MVTSGAATPCPLSPPCPDLLPAGCAVPGTAFDNTRTSQVSHADFLPELPGPFQGFQVFGRAFFLVCFSSLLLRPGAACAGTQGVCMQLSIGLTKVDLVHEQGSLLASRDDLCACFGLTRPEYEHLLTHLPPETMACREDYLPLGAFLTAVSHIMHQDLADPERRTAEQLHELELRTHNYIFLLGALGYDLLGSHQDEVSQADAAAAGAGEAGALPETQTLCRELEGITVCLKAIDQLKAAVLQKLQGLTEHAANSPETSSEAIQDLHRTTSDLYDLMHTTCWEYTRWYALCSARFFMNSSVHQNKEHRQGRDERTSSEG